MYYYVIRLIIKFHCKTWQIMGICGDGNGQVCSPCRREQEVNGKVEIYLELMLASFRGSCGERLGTRADKAIPNN